MARDQAIFTVSGIKNSGKTTLMTKLIPAFIREGYKVAAIKHDGHEFGADTKGTDTHRFKKAGAYGTAIFSASKYMLVKDRPINEWDLIRQFPEADIIILEGFKGSDYPKVEVVRSEISRKPVCPAENLLALVSDCPLDLGGVPVFGLDDAEALAKMLLRYIKEGRLRSMWFSRAPKGPRVQETPYPESQGSNRPPL